MQGVSSDCAASIDPAGTLVGVSYSDRDAVGSWQSCGTKNTTFANYYQRLEWSEDRDPACEDGRAPAHRGFVSNIAGATFDNLCCMPPVGSIDH
eukprot:1440920-Pyramimonas_sp.AAC.1